jgi:hypothetical protein
MSDSDELAPEAHGVHGAPREDGEMQEAPQGTDAGDEEEWADATETGGDAS